MPEIYTRKGEAILVDEADYERLSCFSWRINDKGYACHTAPRFVVPRQIYMHRMLMAFCHRDGRIVDHVNGNRRDNRRVNLRECNKAQNRTNAKINANNPAGLKGVSFNKKARKFIARVRVNGIEKHLGSFDSAQQAHAAYCDAARQLYGDFVSVAGPTNRSLDDATTAEWDAASKKVRSNTAA